MRTLITLSLIVLTTTSSWAQDGRWQLGVQAGPGLSWLRGNRLINRSDALFGPAAGLTVQVDLSKRFGVRLGAGYQRKGMREEVTLTDVNGTPVRVVSSRNAMDHLVVPVMAQVSFGDRARLVIAAGPYAGLLMHSRRSFGDERDYPTVDNTNELEPWDLGVSASVGGAFDVSGHIVLRTEVRYDKGLTNISALPVVDDGSIRTHAVSLLVGCSYRFGKAL